MASGYLLRNIDSPITPSTPSQQTSLAVADVNSFIAYLKKVVPVLLDECDGVPSELENALQDKIVIDTLKKFLSDFSVNVLFIKKSFGDDYEENSSSYSFSLQVFYDNPKSTSIALIKCGAIVESCKKFHSQIRSISLNSGTPYETLQAYITNAVSPYLKSYLKKNNLDSETKTLDKQGPTATIEKKLSELEMGLLSIQQNVDIPEVNLQIHPVVSSISKKCYEENRKPKVEDYDDKINDSNFLNQLQSGVNKWIREIQNEINFWINLERALYNIQEKRGSIEINLTLDILKQGKRFHATISFDSDTGLKQAIESVRDYNILMKDFPINDLLLAIDLNKISEIIQAIFNHLKKIKSSKYPINRFLKLIECISKDLSYQMLKLLMTKRLMYCSFEEFDKIFHVCILIFNCWDDEFEKLILLLKELINKKKRDDTFKSVLQVNPFHKQLQIRIENVRKFRLQHEQLRHVIIKVLNNSRAPKNENFNDPKAKATQFTDSNSINEVNDAYDTIKDIDILDLSKEGADSWEASLKLYEENIDRVEARIAVRLRDQLGSAKNANEMFRIFSLYNALFVRPQIKGAIREYQTQLLQKVKIDIEALHTKFKVQYCHSKSCKLSRSKDIPFVAGSIIWAKQIEKQLFTYLKRVEDVLGKGWETHIDGQKLKSHGDNFKHQLNTQALFDEWSNKVQQKSIGINGKIYIVENQRTKGNFQKLRLNFSTDTITLAKETRNLKNLGFRIPLNIVNKAHQVNQIYPYAVSLLEAIVVYDKICNKLNEKSDNQLLVASIKKEVQNLIYEGGSLVWESYKLEPYVIKTTQQIFSMAEKVDELYITDGVIEKLLDSLENCVYEFYTISDILNKIQKCVDELSLRMYSNLSEWVFRLDAQVERKLLVRLQKALKYWTMFILKSPSDLALENDDIQYDIKINPIVHEIAVRNQVLYVNPSIEETRIKLFESIFQFENVLINQKRIQYSSYYLNSENEYETEKKPKTYRDLIMKLPDDGKVLDEAYLTVERLLTEASNYLKTWLGFQSLWDLQPDVLYARLGTDLNTWMACLNQIKEARKTFDTHESQCNFGLIIINYGKVQSKVNLKYDSCHKEVLSKFGNYLGNLMRDYNEKVSKSRNDLETQSLDASTTAEAVSLITNVQSYRKNVKKWEDQKNLFRDGQKMLERQRYQFPDNWLYSDNVEGEYSSFVEILSRKQNAIQTQISEVQGRLLSEEKVLNKKVEDLVREFDRDQPQSGTVKPSVALNLLSSFETKLNKLKEERKNISTAKEALEMQEPGRHNIYEEQLKITTDEIAGFRNVWNEMKEISEQLDDLKEKQWLAVKPKHMRSTLDELIEKLKKMPPKMRRYECYNYYINMLDDYVKNNTLLSKLKSEALKERHWRQIMKFVNVSWNLNELTLGQMWEVDLLKCESSINEILTVAQGEKGLEEFLKQVCEFWKENNLELVNYQNKCQIIKKWDELFDKIKEHIQSLSSMRMSPYYKEFEEEASSWEDKLNRINNIFDIWIDVQRRWVYLDGIFGSSADIKHLLPNEAQKFLTVSTEFLNLMKKVSRSPLVIEVLNIPNVQKTLERLADLLNKIQKALGEYLEKQRASFPRFYFVGDEDLLEIIGNSQNLPRLQKHFKKMFAGVNSIVLNEDNTIVLGIQSKEGEQVIFKTPVSVTENPRINEWLTKVESEMKISLARLLAESITESAQFRAEIADVNSFTDWLDKYQTQLICLTAQIGWCHRIDDALKLIESSANSNDLSPLEKVLESIEKILNVLADSVLKDQPSLRRKKLEHMIIEHVHQRDVTRQLIQDKVNKLNSFEWLGQLRFYFDSTIANPIKQLSIQIANAKFDYGFEYLGVQDKLVQTPLTDRCFLTMTQALHYKLGGSPFGPAGTGKTESVKCLGNQLGKFVLTFNCDETFDFQAMGRIFVGLCQVGAWGCFDEFNRLEECMLSAVSQQIQTIQEALKNMKNSDSSLKVEIVGKEITVNPDMAIFITMNPGYAGRSNLPDNLKKLFRSLAMTQPNKVLIAQVMLYSQGFRSAELLANKVVPFFTLCSEQLSSQSHYDFGLRSLKSVLVMAGNVKRDKIKLLKEKMIANSEPIDENKLAEMLPEKEILIQSIMESFVPRLVATDLPLLSSLLNDVFPGASYSRGDLKQLKDEIKNVCNEMNLIYDDDTTRPGGLWLEKVLQLYQITNLNHGLMMVGPTGSGKSCAWKVLLKALHRIEGVEGVAHVIDPKSITKDELYGYLDPNTREWKDGLFTHFLRKVIDNVRGELSKRQWIIFDGDVDPEWVENLNSVLDDNKLLTLPNGERLALPPNIRILFEVQDLKYATLATVSRCGMIWFSEDVVTNTMLFNMYLNKLKNVSLDESEQVSFNKTNDSSSLSPTIKTQRYISSILEPFFKEDGLVGKALEFASHQEHIMDFLKARCLEAMFSMMNQIIRNVIQYNNTHSDFVLAQEQIKKYITKSLVISIIWSFSGDGKLKVRNDLGDYIRTIINMELPSSDPKASLIDYEVAITGEWHSWASKVPQIDVDTSKIAGSDIVIPTIDTIRHENLLYTWLAEHKPLLLCGPPGSGKTMTLFSALRALPEMEVVGLNFSSATTPELMLKTFDHYCEYKKTHEGVVLAPTQLNKWLVMFCDEINLPDEDKYGTQRIIMFIRQCVEYGGFYRTSDQTWIKLERIQFVGACNPPTDPGRKPLSLRFLRHVPLVYVDYPGELSLKQIYGTFNRAMLRKFSNLRTCTDSLTNSMVEFFLKTQEKFTADVQPHYIYSPREMSRWVRGINEVTKSVEEMSVESLVRLWAHEALRLFHDRLIKDEERKWTETNIDEVARRNFSNVNFEEALKRPILYSKWLTNDYQPVQEEELRNFIKAKLKIFCEEELDVKLVLFDAVLDHVLRIDRVFRQSQGHLLLIGISGAGKTTLTRFVAWINGISVFQVKVHNKYTMEDFDEDLRNVLRRSGCKREKIAFIIDESKVFDSSFLERMNTLLANGEVPGLFEGDEYAALMNQCKESTQRQGLMLDSQEELYKWFTNEVMKNLHIVLTMNPGEDGLKDKTTTSPALFNRCVLNWFGDWSRPAYYQVSKEFTAHIEMEKLNFKPSKNFERVVENLPVEPTYCEVVLNSFVYVHQSLHQINQRIKKRNGKTVAVTPRHYLDFITHFASLFKEKRAEIEEQQLHLNNGLKKIKETVEQVEELQKSLSVKRAELEKKNNEANSKLKQMVIDQQEAEKTKLDSQELQKVLAVQTEEIEVKRNCVMNDLSRVEPTLQEAKLAVGSIKKQNLVEIKNLQNPPTAIKLALESICLLMNQETNDWKSIRGIIMKENFITTILHFKAEDVTNEIKEKMQARYIKNPDYSYEKINRASVACGPLVKWAIAQLEYADMLNKVEPLRNELRELEEGAEINKKKSENLQSLITELEKKIAQYKVEYAELISEAQSIKADLSSVEAKVERSVNLLNSLSSERVRWDETNESFKSQMNTIVGDCLLNSAFMSYAGYYDQGMRLNLFNQWKRQLIESDIQFRKDISRTEYLSNADERLRWNKENGLPVDELCTENAIMLKRFNRYPLIVDPSGQATEFILNEFKNKKIIKTSFLDESFRKHLESALRFGTSLLVQDVESYDPILNPVLNKELRRINGRVLISIGDQDIDFSPSFSIFLCTRDPTVEFTPDVASRVTFVNFTVTKKSLQSQCLNQVLKAERPDVDAKRTDLLKLQGEFQQKLRFLEKGLLQALNEAKGKILDDDSVLSRLETLKTEATEIAHKVHETDKVMAEIQTVTELYMPLANACSGIYFSMESLSQISFLYQYSLQFFFEMFTYCLFENEPLNQVKDCAERIKIITNSLFKTVYCRVTRGMLNKDRMVFAMLLVQTFIKCGNSEIKTCDSEIEYLLNPDETMSDNTPQIKGLNKEQSNQMSKLANKFSVFSSWKKPDSIINADFLDWLKSPNPELEIPNNILVETKPISKQFKALYDVLLINALRPDRTLAVTKKFVFNLLSDDTLKTSESVLDFTNIIDKELKCNTPMLLCSTSGNDSSGKIEDLATEQSKQLYSIAIGSAEGFEASEKAINSASRSGHWVLLKNVHLAPSWLAQLEKKIHNLQSHPSFRLFLSMDIMPKLPASLLRIGRCFVFEPSTGIKPSLLRTITNISTVAMEKEPKERCHLYFLTSWFNSVVAERLRYTPLGWSKKYEFNESDFKCALDTIDAWVDLYSRNNTNLSPELLPWDAMQTLISSCIYGGRIDNEFDQNLLQTFVKKVFAPESFKDNFKLVEDNLDLLTVSRFENKESCSKWVHGIEFEEKPSWLGLPNNAERLLLKNMADEMLKNLLICQDTEDEIEEAESSLKIKAIDDVKPAWMKQLQNSSIVWLKLLDEKLTALKRTNDNIKDPLFRFFEREISSGLKLKKCVQNDLTDIKEICEGTRKATNHHRNLMNDLSKGIIPTTWKKYTIPKLLSVVQWVNDFSLRIKQLQRISNAFDKNGLKALKKEHVWLGGLFTPEAYLTATRQFVAQYKSWSLEELVLSVTFYDTLNAELSDSSFGVIESKLQGGQTKLNKLYLNDEKSTDCTLIALNWSRLEGNKSNADKNNIYLPVYLNYQRTDLLFKVNAESGEPGVDESIFYKKGVAILSSSIGF